MLDPPIPAGNVYAVHTAAHLVLPCKPVSKPAYRHSHDAADRVLPQYYSRYQCPSLQRLRVSALAERFH